MITKTVHCCVDPYPYSPYLIVDRAIIDGGLVEGKTGALGLADGEGGTVHDDDDDVGGVEKLALDVYSVDDGYYALKLAASVHSGDVVVQDDDDDDDGEELEVRGGGAEEAGVRGDDGVVALDGREDSD